MKLAQRKDLWIGNERKTTVAAEKKGFVGIGSPHSQKANEKVAKKEGRKTEASKIGGKGRKESAEADRKRQEDKKTTVAAEKKSFSLRSSEEVYFAKVKRKIFRLKKAKKFFPTV